MTDSSKYISDEELEAWLKDRFGPRHLFNCQLARDLLDWGVRVALADKSSVDAGNRVPESAATGKCSPGELRE